MPRLQALTLVSALFLALSTLSSTIPAAHALTPRGEHARMIKRYNHNNLHNRQILDDIFNPNGDDGDAPAGASQTNSASVTRGGGLGGVVGTIIGGGGQSATSTESELPESTSEVPFTTRSVASATRPPTSLSSISSTTGPQPTLTRIVYENATPEQKAEIDKEREYQSTLSRIPENVRVILIVVASVLAGLIIIWTAVRKWKLRSSRSFQNRLAPIDWQPDGAEDKLPPPGPMTEISDKDSIRRNMFAPDAPSSLAPPAHDFTAGPAGYARSASPMPNPYARTPSPAPYRAMSPAPAVGLQRYPSNGSGNGPYEPVQHRGY